MQKVKKESSLERTSATDPASFMRRLRRPEEGFGRYRKPQPN